MRSTGEVSNASTCHWNNRKEIDGLEDLDVDGRKRINFIIKKNNERACTKCSWLRVGTSRELIKTR